MNALQQMIFPDENAPIHRKKTVTAAASVKSKGSVLAQKKKKPGGGPRKALNDITNKSGIHPKAASKTKQIASASASAKCEIDDIVAGEMFLHDHSKCIKEQQKSLWGDHYFSADILLHHDSSCSVKEKNRKHDKEMVNDRTCEAEPEEISSPKLSDWLKSSTTTPWRSPIRQGSMMMMMMPSTPLAWRFESAEFTLKEDLF